MAGELAADVWNVADRVQASHLGSLQSQFGLEGHSIGAEHCNQSLAFFILLIRDQHRNMPRVHAERHSREPVRGAFRERVKLPAPPLVTVVGIIALAVSYHQACA